MRKFTVIVCIIIIHVIEIYCHPVHISVTSIEIKPTQNEINVMLKLFKDDLKLAIFHNFEVEIDLMEDADTCSHIDLVNQYINNHFSLLFKKALKMRLVGVDFDENNIWLKYKIVYKKLPKTIRIENSFFNDIYYDQKNLVIFKYNNFDKGFELDYINTTFDVNFNEIGN